MEIADVAPARRSRSPGVSSSTARAVLLAAVLGTALAYMSDDMLNLAIPSVARDLQATVTDAQWILNAYYVSLVSCVIAAGAIGDIAGHRRVFIGGIIGFATGAVLCASAPAVWFIIAGRFIQGISAAMLLSAGLALVTYLSPAEARSRAIGRFLGLVAAVPAIGPFVSGALIDLLSWRWLFIVPLALPLRFFRRRRFLGGNVVWLLGCMACWGAVFFVAVMLQATLRQSPLVAGLMLTPIYLVMMVGSPLAGRIADRIGPRWPILLGLGIYAAGMLLLGRIGQTTALVPDVIAAMLVFAAGMALFTAPLAAATMSALDEGEQGVASGMNNAMGQLAGLLGVAILPAVAGLAGVSFGDPAFAAGYSRALGAAALIAVVCVPIAAWSFNGDDATQTAVLS